MAQVVIQKLNKSEPTPIELAIRYFTIIAAITNTHLTPKQIELLAWTAVKGTISSGGSVSEFVAHFKSSKGTLENLKHSLVKKGFIIKTDGKYRVVPSLSLNFSSRVILQINLTSPNGDSENREDTGR